MLKGGGLGGVVGGGGGGGVGLHVTANFVVVEVLEFTWANLLDPLAQCKT